MAALNRPRGHACSAFEIDICTWPGAALLCLARRTDSIWTETWATVNHSRDRCIDKEGMSTRKIGMLKHLNTHNAVSPEFAARVRAPRAPEYGEGVQLFGNS